MKIQIFQNGQYYKIYCNDEKNPSLTGRWSITWGALSCSIYEKGKKESFLSIKRKFKFPAFWKTSYLFTMGDKACEVNPVSIVKGHWKLIDRQTTFDFYLHSGLHNSLFMNNRQVASFTKKFISSFAQNAMVIHASPLKNKLPVYQKLR